MKVGKHHFPKITPATSSTARLSHQNANVKHLLLRYKNCKIRFPKTVLDQELFTIIPITAMDSQSFRPGLLDRFFVGLFHLVNFFLPWHKLPGILGAFNLDLLRVELCQYNLYDGYSSATAQGNPEDSPLEEKRFLTARNSDGRDNSLVMPRMGCSGMRFGRNFPRKYCKKPTEEELWTPNPRLVSEALMSREPGEFKPAITLNLLAAAWIQFQVHDWVFHESVRSPHMGWSCNDMLTFDDRARRRMMCRCFQKTTGTLSK